MWSTGCNSLVDFKNKSMNYYKIDHAATFQAGGELQYFPVDEKSINPGISKQLFFALNKPAHQYKSGKRVRVTNISTGSKELGTVWAVNNNAPAQIKLDSGKIIPIFGLIIELLPILEKLIELIKGLFRK